MNGSGCGIESSRVEVAQDMADKFRRQPMEELLFFIAES